MDDKPRIGIKCPRCECRDLRVTKVWHKGTITVRRRECRHCGFRMTTNERLRPEGE